MFNGGAARLKITEIYFFKMLLAEMWKQNRFAFQG